MACVDVHVFNSYICLDMFVAAGSVEITDVAEVTVARPSAGNFTDSHLVVFLTLVLQSRSYQEACFVYVQ